MNKNPEDWSSKQSGYSLTWFSVYLRKNTFSGPHAYLCLFAKFVLRKKDKNTGIIAYLKTLENIT